MPILEVKNLYKNFGSTKVLKDISFSLERGKALAIIGSSGSGKTTLLRCLNFLETPNEGQIIVNGEPLFDAADHAAKSDAEIRRSRLHFGMVFQSFNLFPQYTALENVMLAPLLLAKEQPDYKKNKREIHEQIEHRAIDLLTRMSLEGRMSHYPHQLSGGQQQRVAIARALATSPKILLCDEATSALDPTTTTSILNLLREINRRMGITIVIITHEMSVVESTCTHVAIIDDGQLAECGTVESVFSQPKSAAAKKLIFRTAGADSGAMGERMIRIVFEGSSADEPTISDLAMQCHVAVNIRYADTREVSGKLFGQMILQLPEDHLQQEKAIYFLQNKGLRVEEVNGHVHG